MIKSVKDKQAEMNTKQAEMKVAMESEVKACNDKIDSLSQTTNDIREKMNMLLNLLGAEKKNKALFDNLWLT